MKCKKLHKIYDKYIDDQLSDAERESIEKHISECPDCARELESSRQINLLLQKTNRPKASNEYWETYWERLEKKLPNSPKSFIPISRISYAFAGLIRRPAVLGRAIMYIFFVAFLLYTTADRETETPHLHFDALHTAKKLEEAESGVSTELFAEEEVILDIDSDTMGRADSQVNERLKGISAGKLAKAADQPVKLAEVDANSLALRSEMPALKDDATETKLGYAPAKPKAMMAPAPHASTAQIYTEKSTTFGVDAQSEYDAAEKHFENKEYAQAIPAYQNFITANTVANIQDDRTLNAIYQIGEANYQMGNYSDALSNFAVVANSDTEEIRDAEKAQAFNYSRRETQLAREGAKLAPSLDAKEESVGRTRGRTTARRPDRAAGIAGDAIQLDHSDIRDGLIARAIFRQAESFENLSKIEEALNSYKMYLEKYPQGEFISQAKEKLLSQKKAETSAKTSKEKADKKPAKENSDN